MMHKITEIIPDSIPGWAKEAMDDGQFFRIALDRITDLEARLSKAQGDSEIYRTELNRFEGHKPPFEVSPIIMASHVDGFEEHGFGGCCWGTGEKYFNRHKSDYAASLYYSKAYVDKIRDQLSEAPQ